MDTFNCGWPQIALIALIAMGLGVTAAEHGKPRSAHNIWYSMAGVSITLTLLYFGGFFTK